MFDRLNNYHPNIKIIIELNPTKFLDTPNLSTSMVPINSTLPEKAQNYLHHKPPKRYKVNTINGDLHRSKRISNRSDKSL